MSRELIIKPPLHIFVESGDQSTDVQVEDIFRHEYEPMLSGIA